jgi:hypothetical protein
LANPEAEKLKADKKVGQLYVIADFGRGYVVGLHIEEVSLIKIVHKK